MNTGPKTRIYALVALFLLAPLRHAAAIPLLDTDPDRFGKDRLLREAEDPAKYPEFAKYIAEAKTYPREYAGTVYLDGKPLAGVRVTDAMGFVTTDAQGRYRIKIEPDAMHPYLPSRTIGVCWPDGTFPVKDPKTGRLLWWKRLSDVKQTPDKVDFFLETRRYKAPLVIGFASDQHDAFSGPNNLIMPAEIKQGGNRVDLVIMGGDDGYMGLKDADACFANVERVTTQYPVPVIHVEGNHDIIGPLFGPHPLAGFGGFTKYLGPVRWSFDACGVHIVTMTYWTNNQDSVRWLDRDLASVPSGMPVYCFTHSWGPYLGDICRRWQDLRLVHTGHSHQTLPCGMEGNAEFWTYFLYYRLVYIDGYDFDFVERDVNVNPLYRYSRQNWTPGGEHAGWTDKTVRNGTLPVPCFPDSSQYDIELVAAAKQSTAKRWGLRVTNESGHVRQFYYDAATRTLHMAGRETYFVLDPVKEYEAAKVAPPILPDGIMRFHINFQSDRIHCTMNGKISYLTFTGAGKASRVEVFAEDGVAKFLGATVWQRGSPTLDWNGYRREPYSQEDMLRPWREGSKPKRAAP